MFLIFLTVALAAEPTLSGVVLDDMDMPVPGAVVRVGEQAVLTDAEGRFTLEIPAGSTELRVERAGFGAAVVAVPENGPLTVHLAIEEPGLEMVVESSRVAGGTEELLEQRHEAPVVTEVMGAQEMARSGDPDAAQALRRVTGLTLVGGRYVYVRGLGERYSATLLDGAQLPSPEPERRVVPADLFPASILESVTIQKAYTPDMPGEFGGGVLQLQTRSFPSEPTLRLAAGGAYQHGTTFQTAMMGDHGPTDFFGVDGGYRSLPGEIQAASADEPLLEQDMFSERGYSAEELEAFGEAVSNRWWVAPTQARPDLSVQGTLGNSWQLGAVELGAMGALSFSNAWELDRYQRSYTLVGDGGDLEIAHTYDFEELANTQRLAAIGAVGLRLPGDHAVNFTTVLTRNTDYETRVFTGENRDVATEIAVTRVRWIERQLFFNQVSGEHPLGDFGLDWAYAFSRATRVEPDTREWRVDHELGTEDWMLSDRPEGNQILTSVLADRSQDLRVDVDHPVLGEGRVEVGGQWVSRAREVDTRRYKYMSKGELSRDEALLAGASEDWFQPDTIGDDGFQFEEFTSETDNYDASQGIQAGWVLADLPFGEHFRVLGGTRIEHSAQRVSTYELFNPDGVPVVAELDTLDLLPALNMTWAFSDEMQLRLAYGRTLSRPDFRELSPATFDDVTGGRQVYGNPELERASIHNVDLRWELYPSPAESLSFGLFAKRFVDPIEQVVVASAQNSVTWQNAPGATNLGLEVEGRVELPFAPGFTVGGNVSLIRSRVDLGEGSGIQTNDVRPLQGQSPWVLNGQLGYENAELRSSVVLLYTAFGPRIEEVGALGAPDVVELPVHTVDLAWTLFLPKDFTLRVRGGNLLNYPVVRVQGEQEVERREEGWTASAQIAWAR